MCLSDNSRLTDKRSVVCMKSAARWRLSAFPHFVITPFVLSLLVRFVVLSVVIPLVLICFVFIFMAVV